MTRDFDFRDGAPKHNRFKDKKRNKKFISEETYDQNRLSKQFKKKKKDLEEQESWDTWDGDNEIY